MNVSMADVLVIIRIYPEEPDSDLEDIVERVRRSLPEKVVLRDYRSEEMGYGLSSLLVGFTMPDSEGVLEELEEALRGVDGVSEISVEHVTRIL